MGLEIVELMMRVEEVFEIEIPDEEAGQLESVGQVYTCVLAKLGLTASDRCMSSVAFYRTRRALMGLSGAPRRSIRPSTPTELLLPRDNRKQHWAYLGEMMGCQLPELERPDWAVKSIAGVCLALAVASGFATFISYYYAVVLLAGCVSFGWLAHRATAPLALNLPAECPTVEGVTRTLLVRNYGLFGQREESWTGQEVWDALCALIVDELQIDPKRVLKDTQFVRDLNLD